MMSWAPCGGFKRRSQAVEPDISALSASLVMAAVLLSAEGRAGFQLKWTPKINDLDD